MISNIRLFRAVDSIFEHFFKTVPLPPPERKLPKQKVGWGPPILNIFAYPGALLVAPRGTVSCRLEQMVTIVLNGEWTPTR